MRRLILAALLIVAAPSVFAADVLVPDPTITPGAWNSPPTPLAVMCTAGFTKKARHVTASRKAEVFRRYGYDPKIVIRRNYEVDHLVPLELDGTNVLANLWPESYLTQPGARHKDVLENKLHRLVCQRKMDSIVAQMAIATDWRAAYQKYVLAPGK